MSDSCRDIRPRVAAYCDGELPADEARLVEQHLAQCATCAAERTSLEAASRLLRAHWDDASTASGFAGARERLVAAFDGEPDPAWMRAASPVAAAATAASREATAASVARPRMPMPRRPAFRWASSALAVAALVVLELHGGTPGVLRPRRDGPPLSRTATPPTTSQFPTPLTRPRTPVGTAPTAAAPAPTAAAPAPSDAARATSAAASRVARPRATASTPLPVASAPPPRRVVPSFAPQANAYSVPAPVILAPATTGADSPAPMPALDQERSMGAAESRSGDMVSAQTPPTASRSVTKRVVQRAEEPAGLAIQRRAAISPRPFAATDTVLGLATLQPMAEREEQFLTDDSGDLPLAEQGARWRVLGEVREWLARTLHSRDEAESAMHAYVRASAADPRHRGADAARLARVRQLLSSLSAE